MRDIPMAQTPPARVPFTAPAKSVPPPAPAPERVAAIGLSHIGRLRAALANIDAAPETTSAARSILGGYYAFVNPKLTCENLPRSLRRHPIHPENHLRVGTKWDLLFHHIGSTVKALQEAYAIDSLIPSLKTPTQIEAQKQNLAAAVAVLEKRVARLEVLAAEKPSDWYVAGSDAEGWFLQTAREHTDDHAAVIKSLQSKEDAKRAIEIADENGEAAAAD